MNKNTFVTSALIIIALSAALLLFFSSRNDNVVINNPSTPSSITYKNTDYGFDFSLPSTWQGYSVIKDTWTGTVLTNTTAQSGPKLIMRNPKWTASAPYEDIPVLVFTLSQWNTYLAEKFSISAAPIQARELGRNNVYVFALPPRWDFDYSLGYKEAQDIILGKPLSPFNIGVTGMPHGKLNINLICERAISYMRFVDVKSSDVFVADCKAGKHPEVIEKYKLDMNLGKGTTI